ncbi:RHS repeat-associated core domain-containing protein [archaeon]|nr:RHS repeat-associated core domain-containing protein [archaeon]
MKREVLLILLVVFIPFGLAKEIPIEKTYDVDKTSDEVSQGVITYIYAGSKLLASKSDGEITYHYQDRLGSDVESKSLPFGQEIVNGERFSFTGKELDSSGLHYFSARYYDSDLGRFTSVDPVKDNHAYSYVMNNPLRFVDPSGMDEREDKLQAYVTQYSVEVFHPMIEKHRGDIASASEDLGVPPEAILSGMIVEDIRFYNKNLKEVFMNVKSNLRTILSKCAPIVLEKTGHAPNIYSESNLGMAHTGAVYGAFSYLHSVGFLSSEKYDYFQDMGYGGYENFKDSLLPLAYTMKAHMVLWEKAGYDLFSYDFKTISTFGERVGVLETLNSMAHYNSYENAFITGKDDRKIRPHNSPKIGGSLLHKAGYGVSYGEIAKIYVESGLARDFLEGGE